MADLEDTCDRTTVATTTVTSDAIQNATAKQTPDASGNNSENDDYIVELRAPKRNPAKPGKRFRLFLRHATSSEDDDSDSMSGTTSDEFTPEVPRDQGEEWKEGKTCTQDNWKILFSYKTQKYDRGPIFSSNQEAFERAEHEQGTDTKELTITRMPSKHVQLAIKSPFLQKHLRKAVDVEYYHGVTLSASNTLLMDPFGPLYHHIEDMKANVAADTEATPADRNHMNALYYFSTLGWPASLYNDVRSQISEGFIMYDHLWALYKPGDFAVTKDSMGQPIISKITSVKLEQMSRAPGQTYIIYSWFISLVKLIWKTNHFRRMSYQQVIPRFADAKRITDLPIYPLAHHDSAEALRDAAISSGKAWKKYCQGEPVVMSYEGQAVSLVMEKVHSSLNYMPPPPPSADKNDPKPLRLVSSVIVDPDAANKVNIQANIDGKRRLQRPFTDNVGGMQQSEVSEFTDEEFMICPTTITVYSPDDNDWYDVDVSGLREKEWKPKSFDRLVLDQAKKKTLIRIASTNSRLVQASKSNDIIEGKGKGVVLLLYGPPGVGKTLTAEVLSEFTKRPLVKVNLGRVATHDRWEEALEQIFSNAEDWKAILLIDEAEIVLEKRTFERMTQNSWISVFLRKLEYYKGILILTTNLIDCIDEAFESRISYPIQFLELNREDRYQIWADFINNMKMLPAYKATLMNELDRWSQAEINGRQIRNVILMAENLAASDEKHPRLMPQHIDELLNVTLEFCDYNRNNSTRLKKIQFTGPSY